MKILLDTQALFWWLGDPARLSRRAMALVTDSKNTILVSPASAWEMAIKVSLGKLDSLTLVLELTRHIEEEGFTEVPIGVEVAVRAGLLPLHHRDPFDRLLVAQAQSLHCPILSSDQLLDRYDVKRVW
jgi:PIN domain nuclease of toxin-antitoxin system